MYLRPQLNKVFNPVFKRYYCTNNLVTRVFADIDKFKHSTEQLIKDVSSKYELKEIQLKQQLNEKIKEIEGYKVKAEQLNKKFKEMDTYNLFLQENVKILENSSNKEELKWINCQNQFLNEMITLKKENNTLIQNMFNTTSYKTAYEGMEKKYNLTCNELNELKEEFDTLSNKYNLTLKNTNNKYDIASTCIFVYSIFTVTFLILYVS